MLSFITLILDLFLRGRIAAKKEPILTYFNICATSLLTVVEKVRVVKSQKYVFCQNILINRFSS